MSSVIRRAARRTAPEKINQTASPGSKLPIEQNSADFTETEDDPLVFTREDWTALRDLSRLPMMAGVSESQLVRCAVKELCDNGLDTGGKVRVGILENSHDVFQFYVENDGPPMPGTDDEIAYRYSMRRPLASSKVVRLPTRGMLGNGTRVVAGVVCCGDGEIRLSTNGRTLTLEPQREDGSTAITNVAPWDGEGTRVEVTLRGRMATLACLDDDVFQWAYEAIDLMGRSSKTLYKGKSSPWWYSRSSLWELVTAAGSTAVEKLVERTFDGCSDRRRAAGVAGELVGRRSDTLTADEVQGLLDRSRAVVPPVKPDRLGRVGKRLDFISHAIQMGEFDQDGATIPYVVECWANRCDEPDITIAVNRTPVLSPVSVRRDEGIKYAVFGAGLKYLFDAGKKGCGEYRLIINVITPFVPLKSSGKEPDLALLWGTIRETLEKAIRVTKRNAPQIKGKKTSQKNIVLKHIPDAVEELSAGGATVFALRQMFYFIRPRLIQAIGREPLYGTFCKIISKHEDQHGDIDGLYRDDRGVLIHPHTRETIPLGTRSIAAYERPKLLFHNVIYIEKGGPIPSLSHAKVLERWDCAITTSQGFATRAAKKALQIMQDAGEPVRLFCLHDADGPGTCIYQNLRDSLASDGIEVINLGLDPAEAREMGLQSEPVKKKNKTRVPVGDYIPDEDAEWLQRNRIELNAMTPPQLIEWLEGKLALYASRKIVPTPNVIREAVRVATDEELTRLLTEQVLREANIAVRVAKLRKANSSALRIAADQTAVSMPNDLNVRSDKHWSFVAKEAASVLARDIANGKSTRF